MSISERRLFWWGWSVLTVAVVVMAWRFMTTLKF
jgi:hypothetical protein